MPKFGDIAINEHGIIGIILHNHPVNTLMTQTKNPNGASYIGGNGWSGVVVKEGFHAPTGGYPVGCGWSSLKPVIMGNIADGIEHIIDNYVDPFWLDKCAVCGDTRNEHHPDDTNPEKVTNHHSDSRCRQFVKASNDT